MTDVRGLRFAVLGLGEVRGSSKRTAVAHRAHLPSACVKTWDNEIGMERV